MSEENPLEEWMKEHATQIDEIPWSKPPEIETEDIFDSESAPEPYFDNPMQMLTGMMADLKDMALHRGAFEMPSAPQLEHKVKIFWLSYAVSRDDLNEIAAQIEALLNDGYCCHMPTVCNDFVIMDFSRRKETEEDGEQ